MTQLGFQTSQSDPCLFLHQTEKIMVLNYCDDQIWLCPDNATIWNLNHKGTSTASLELNLTLLVTAFTTRKGPNQQGHHLHWYGKHGRQRHSGSN